MRYLLAIGLVLTAAAAFAQLTITVRPGESVTVVGAPAPTATPTPTPIACGGGGRTVVVTPSMSLNAALNALKPGDCGLLQAGGIWHQQFDVNVAGTATAPITFGVSGSGAAPLLDERNAHPYCVDAISGVAKYLIFNGWECTHATQRGVTFQTSNGSMPGITVENFYIHDTGPGCANANGSCAGTDDGSYANQLDFEDFTQGADGVHFLNDVVKWCGGHNCLQVHHDTGAVVVSGNTVGPGCVHGCLDVKGVGSPTAMASVDHNVSSCGRIDGSSCAAFYTENVYSALGEYVTYDSNTANGPIGFQECAGGCLNGPDCPLMSTFTNNVYGGTGWALYAHNNMCGNNAPSSTAHLTQQNNQWGNGSVEVQLQ